MSTHQVRIAALRDPKPLRAESDEPKPVCRRTLLSIAGALGIAIFGSTAFLWSWAVYEPPPKRYADLRDNIFFEGWNFQPSVPHANIDIPVRVVDSGQFWGLYLQDARAADARLPVYISEYDASGEACRKLVAHYAFYSPQGEVRVSSLPSMFRPGLTRFHYYGVCSVRTTGFHYNIEPDHAAYTAAMLGSVLTYALAATLGYLVVLALIWCFFGTPTIRFPGMRRGADEHVAA